MKYDIYSALISLKPGKNFSYKPEVGGYAGINYDTEANGDTCPTEDELNTELTRLTNAEAMRLLREERDTRLTKTDWRASSDLTLSDAWKTYRQSLRDLPANTTPTCDSDGNLDSSSVTWPTEPS
tara:strand:+ start:561 stop:935 length:375 start_codon:yes stop_codon:yes gene_type:complete